MFEGQNIKKSKKNHQKRSLIVKRYAKYKQKYQLFFLECWTEWGDDDSSQIWNINLISLIFYHILKVLKPWFDQLPVLA